jgi:hypothetical protein
MLVVSVESATASDILHGLTSVGSEVPGDGDSLYASGKLVVAHVNPYLVCVVVVEVVGCSPL